MDIHEADCRRYPLAMSHSAASPKTGHINVGTAERILSALGGAALFGCGLKQRSGATPFLLVIGGLLAARGITGHCDAYKKLNVNTAVPPETYGVPDRAGFHVEKSIEIKRSPAQVYGYWRQLKNLPKFMSRRAQYLRYRESQILAARSEHGGDHGSHLRSCARAANASRSRPLQAPS